MDETTDGIPEDINKNSIRKRSFCVKISMDRDARVRGKESILVTAGTFAAKNGFLFFFIVIVHRQKIYDPKKHVLPSIFSDFIQTK